MKSRGWLKVEKGFSRRFRFYMLLLLTKRARDLCSEVTGRVALTPVSVVTFVVSRED